MNDMNSSEKKNKNPKHSSFEAPVRGEILPKDSFKQDKDGFLVLTEIGAYSKSKQILDNIAICVEYKSVYYFETLGKNEKKTCAISKDGGKVINAEEFLKLKEEPVSYFIIDEKDKFIEIDLDDLILTKLDGDQTK